MLGDTTTAEGLTGEEPVVPETAAPETAAPGRRRLADLFAPLSYLALAVFVMGRLWLDPNNQMLAQNRNDHGFFLFMMAHGERVVFHGDSPLWSSRLNAPVGVNMMVNTSMLAASLPLAPITHWFGPAVTTVALLTAGLAGTAAAWYWFLSRHLVESRVAAWVGGLWAGFAPGFISHANGHPNFVCGFVLPFIVWQVLRLREPGRVLRGGVVLGLLVVLQIFLSEELLLFTAIPLVMIVAFYAVARRDVAREAGRRFVLGGLVAVGVAAVPAAYPLWYQFLGPGHYTGLPFAIDRYATSLGSVVAFPRQSIAGDGSLAARLSFSATEDNAFWGVGACVMVVVSLVVLWRSMMARAIACAAVVLLVMSFGEHFRLTAKPGTVPAPLGWLGHLPIFDMVTVPRYALPATVLIGVLFAWAADRARSFGSRRLRVAFRAGLAVALVPLLPVPLPVIQAPTMPAFFAQRMWQPYVAGGRTVVPVPQPDLTSRWNRTSWNSQRMVSMANLAFPAPRGYFIGPKNPPRDLQAAWQAPWRYTSGLYLDVCRTGTVPDMTGRRVTLVRDDLRYWRAGVVVLMPEACNLAAMRATLVGALGQPRQLGGVDVWDVRSLS